MLLRLLPLVLWLAFSVNVSVGDETVPARKKMEAKPRENG